METGVVLGTYQPVNAYRIPNNGDNQQKIANGAYKTVGTPKVAVTKPPPMFQGINGEASVPQSSMVRANVVRS